MRKMKIISDNQKCTGCLACVITCLDHHYNENETDALSGRIYTLTTAASGYTKYVTESCHHCNKAACMEVCPANAISQTDEGWIIADKDLCIGCRACEQACPFGIPQFNASGKMVKCDGCHGDPACVKICPNDALQLSL